MKRIRDYIKKIIRHRIVEIEFKRWLSDDIDEWDIQEAINMPSEEEIAKYHQFSPEFEAKMEALFAEARKRDRKRIEKGLPVLVPPNTPDGVIEWKYVDPDTRNYVDKIDARRKYRSKLFKKGLIVAASVVLVLSSGIFQVVRSGAESSGLGLKVFKEIHDYFESITWGSAEKGVVPVAIKELSRDMLEDGYVEKNRYVSDMSYYIQYVSKDGKDFIVLGHRILTSTQRQENTKKEGGVEKNVMVNNITCRIWNQENGDIIGEWCCDGAIYNICGEINETILLELLEDMID